MLRAAAIVLSGNILNSLLLLARNLAVARLIPVVDYGIASTFAVVLALVEMSSQFGLQKQIVQAKDGDDPHFQAALHGFQVARGMISASILVLIAHPLAQFLGIPEVAWGYQLLALVSLALGFEHFDVHRLSRQLRFWPTFLVGTFPALVTLMMVWPLSFWLGDWRVMLALVIAFPVLLTLTSHLVARRPYRVAFDRAIIGRSLRFGWPLLANSALMFLIFQGDKLIVGRELGMAPLAIFAMGVTLTLTPTLVLARSADQALLPRLSAAAREDPAAFRRTALLSLQIVALAALAFTLGVLLVGGPLVMLLLGEKFAPLAPILLWFALGQAVRTMKAGPGVVMLALGRTGNAMIGNIARVLALPLAWWALVQGQGMLAVLGIALAGELLGLIVAGALMLRHAKLPLGAVLWQQGLVLVLMVGAGAWVWMAAPVGLPPWPVWLGALLAFAAALAAMPDTLRFVRQRLPV